MRKYRLTITIDDDTYPIDDLRDWIKSEGLIIESESVHDIAPSDEWP